MTTILQTSGPSPEAAETLPPERPSWAQAILTFVVRQPLGTIGLVIVVVMFVAGITADWIAPYDPEENDFASMMQAPTWQHILGTDQLGRDLFSRLVFGARTALI